MLVEPPPIPLRGPPAAARFRRGEAARAPLLALALPPFDALRALLVEGSRLDRGAAPFGRPEYGGGRPGRRL